MENRDILLIFGDAMEQTYTTRKGIEKQSYEIKEDGVRVIISSPITKKEYSVSYDEIPANPTTYSERSKPAFWCMVVFWVISIVTFVLLLTGGDVENLAWLFWGSFATVSTVWYLFSKRSYIIYTRFNEVVLYFKLNKNKENADEFITKIKTLKLKYLEAKIKRYLPSLGLDKVNGYIIELREKMILDDDGYEYLTKKVEEFNAINIVGFKKS
jgi:hypothetical protein